MVNPRFSFRFLFTDVLFHLAALQVPPRPCALRRVIVSCDSSCFCYVGFSLIPTNVVDESHVWTFEEYSWPKDQGWLKAAGFSASLRPGQFVLSVVANFMLTIFCTLVLAIWHLNVGWLFPLLRASIYRPIMLLTKNWDFPSFVFEKLIYLGLQVHLPFA